MNKLYTLVFSVACLTYSSCITQKIKKTEQQITSAKAIVANTQAKLSTLQSESNSKLSQGKIDSTLLVIYNQKINTIQQKNDSITTDINEITRLLTNKKAFSKSYKSEVLPKLQAISTYQLQSSSSKILAMLEDGLNNSNFHLFDLAAFFGPGKYAIPSHKKDLAVTSFNPMLDSVIGFANKYATLPRTATLIVLGFADGQGFNEQNPATDTLKMLLQNETANTAQLNQKLSELRAEELINVLSLRFLQRVSEIQGADLFKIDYIGRGKGETYPLPFIKDYKVNDDRRRIVLCYWTVLPN